MPLSRIQSALGFSGSARMGVNAYALTFGGLLLLGAGFGHPGRRRIHA
jgi:hypothetical protein